METIAVPFEADAANRLKQAAAEDGVQLPDLIAAVANHWMEEREALSLSATADENAAMARAIADIEAGRLTDHDEVFARLDAKHRSVTGEGS